MKRRGFLAALLGLPFAAKAVAEMKPEPEVEEGGWTTQQVHYETSGYYSPDKPIPLQNYEYLTRSNLQEEYMA